MAAVVAGSAALQNDDTHSPVVTRADLRALPRHHPPCRTTTPTARLSLLKATAGAGLVRSLLPETLARIKP